MMETEGSLSQPVLKMIKEIGGRCSENAAPPASRVIHTFQIITQDMMETAGVFPQPVLKMITEIRVKLSVNGKSDVELEIQFQDHVWNIPFVNNQSSVDISPVACTRAGLFQHPKDCNMFYECFWDKWLKRFTLHVFSCPEDDEATVSPLPAHIVVQNAAGRFRQPLVPYYVIS
ncbi:uncharacterized protein TNCV_3741851 [Trichonephila clavipes]|nr:uncharacterized protein TNCV_3741851 [Trichonephila clavipes]